MSVLVASFVADTAFIDGVAAIFISQTILMSHFGLSHSDVTVTLHDALSVFAPPEQLSETLRFIVYVPSSANVYVCIAPVSVTGFPDGGVIVHVYKNGAVPPLVTLPVKVCAEFLIYGPPHVAVPSITIPSAVLLPDHGEHPVLPCIF